MTASTYFGLLAEFGAAEIPLEAMCEKYFGLAAPQAKKKAAMHQLPVPAHRTGGQKTPWMISATELAEHLDKQRQAANEEWRRVNL